MSEMLDNVLAKVSSRKLFVFLAFCFSRFFLFWKETELVQEVEVGQSSCSLTEHLSFYCLFVFLFPG